MEVHTPHWTIVLIKFVQEGAHAVVPQLDDTIVEGGEDPGPCRVEGEALHPGGLGLKLGQHYDFVTWSLYNCSAIENPLLIILRNQSRHFKFSK